MLMAEAVDTMDNSTSFSLQEAAKHVSLHPETLRKEIKKGSLQAALLGKKYVISRIELEYWFEERGGGRLFDGDSPPVTSEANAVSSRKKRRATSQQLPLFDEGDALK